MRQNEFVKYRDLAKELCEDYRPLKIWTSENIAIVTVAHTSHVYNILETESKYEYSTYEITIK